MPVLGAVVFGGLAVSGISATLGAALAGIVGATVSTTVATAIGTGAIAGLTTAARGGNISDVLKSAITSGAASYAGAKVGNFVGSQVSSSIGGAAGAITGRVLGGVATGITQSVIKGQDIKQGALLGGISGAMQSFDAALSQNDAWKSLGTVGQSVVKAVASASITGQDVAPAALGALVESTGLISKAINSVPEFKSFINNPENAGASQIIVGAVNNTVAGLIGGAKLSDAALNGILRSTGNYLGKLAKSGLDSFVKDAQKNYAQANKLQEQLQGNEQQQTTLAEQYNSVAKNINDKLQQREALMTEYNRRMEYVGKRVQTDKGYFDVSETQVLYSLWKDGTLDKINSTTDDLNTYYETHRQDLERIDDELALLKEQKNSIIEQYDIASGLVTKDAQKLADETASIVNNTKQAMVAGLDDQFNAAQYKALHPDVADPYEHYLQEGYKQNLPTNFEAAATRELRAKGYDATAEDIKTLTQEMQRASFSGWGEINPVNVADMAANYVDRHVQTPDDVKRIAQDIGLPLTDEQVAKLAGKRTAGDLMSEMWGMLDPAKVRAVTQQPGAIANLLAESVSYKDKSPLAKSYISDAVGDAAVAIYSDTSLNEAQKKEAVQGIISKLNTASIDSAVAAYEGQKNSFESQISSIDSQINGNKLQQQGLSRQIASLSSAPPMLVKPQLDAMTAQMQSLVAQEKDLINKRTSLEQQQPSVMQTLQRRLEAVAADYGNTVKTTAARAIDPDFVPYEYARANNLSATQDPVEHFLTTGREQKLPSNFKQMVEQQFGRVGYKATPEEMATVAQQMYNAPDRQAVIADYINTRMVSPEEVATAAKEMNVDLTPEQVTQLTGQYDQKTLGSKIRELASQAAEKALGALIPSAEAAGADRLVLPEPAAGEAAQPSDYKYFFDVARADDPKAAFAALNKEQQAAVERANREFSASSEERKTNLLLQYRSQLLEPTTTPTESWIDAGLLGAAPEEQKAESSEQLLDILKTQEAEQKKTEAAVDEVGQTGVDQQSIMDALARQKAESDAAIAALERATGQRITEGDTGILSQLEQQAASQKQMEAALRGQIGGVSGTLEQRIAQSAQQQEAQQRAMEAALRGELGGLGKQFEASQQATQAQFGDVNARISQLQQQGMSQAEATSQALRELAGGQSQLEQRLAQSTAQQQAEQRAMEAALRGEIGGLGTQFQQNLIAAMERQGASQAEMEAALRGEISGVGSTFQRSLQEAMAQQQTSQAEMERALRGEIGGLGAGFDQRVSELMTQGRDYQAATNQALLELSQSQQQLGGTLEQRIAQSAAEQQAQQRAMEEALRGEIGGLGEQFQKNLLAAMAEQGASQAEMEAALRGEISGVGSTFERSLQQAMAQQEASQAEMEAALRGEIGGLGGTLQQQIAAAAAQQQAEQAEMEAALRGEIGGLGTTFDKRLADILAQQEEEQASMESALRGYDQRIVDLMEQGQSEQEAMQQALAEVQASQAAQQAATQQQIAGVQTGLGQQISGLGQSLGQALTGAMQQFGTTTQGLQQQIQQTQQQAGMGNLLAMLGMMQQGKKEAPPIPLVGEIKPFEFSTDLLEGLYQPSRTGLLGANDQLLKMTRG